MTIEAKYNKGDEVWLMHNNRPFKTRADAIYITYEGGAVNIEYAVSLSVTKEGVKESLLYPTKEELLKSL